MNKEVSFPLAKLLKEKGFKQKIISFDYYLPNGDKVNFKYAADNKNYRDYSFHAPTIAEVVMWLYEKHGIWISILCDVGYDTLFTYKLYSTIIGSEHCIKNGDRYNSPIEAYEAVIEYTLNNLL